MQILSNNKNNDNTTSGNEQETLGNDYTSNAIENETNNQIEGFYSPSVDIVIGFDTVNDRAIEYDEYGQALPYVEEDEPLPQAFDPRLQRLDAFIAQGDDSTKHPIIVPFATNTAASAYYNMLFSVESAVAAEYAKERGQEYKSKTKASEKVAPNKQQLKILQSNPDFYGVGSLVNPYTLTKLAGGLTTDGPNTFKNHMYDIRSSKRFYDVTVEDDDFLSVTEPTTTNIITWSNKDAWGRTPYSFQDFVFCKYWNIIPNNRLLTLRKYGAPTYDNLNFSNMYLKSENGEKNVDNSIAFAPIATVVSYFGEDTGNSLNSLMSFSTGTPWEELQSDIHSVSGNEGSDPRAVIDSMFATDGTWGGVSADAKWASNLLSGGGFITGKYLSFGKFVGLLDKDGYRQEQDQDYFNKMTQGQVDPSDSKFANKIKGPVNRIGATMQRKAGIVFSQELSLTCEYIARPIGGVNTKAAMLDILANCLEIVSVDAVWWGGGYHFMIEPQMYPFKREDGTNTYMEDLYKGKIFGKDGALAHVVDGVKKFGETDANGNSTGSFEWSNITSKLGEFAGQTLGALGSALSGIASSLFGEGNMFSNIVDKGTQAVSTDEQRNKGKNKLNNLLNNINDMWKTKVVQQTIIPKVEGMKALLTGEPVGNWHLTVGNPLNPMMVIGNLICTDARFEFSDELGPDDFPMEMKVTYTLKHGMARDKGGIESMFNRGMGKIYELPDFVAASSDYETKVDDFTGPNSEDWDGGYINVGEVMTRAQAAARGRTYKAYKFGEGTQLQNLGDARTTFIAKFTPIDITGASTIETIRQHGFLESVGSRSIIRGVGITRKLLGS